MPLAVPKSLASRARVADFMAGLLSAPGEGCELGARSERGAFDVAHAHALPDRVRIGRLAEALQALYQFLLPRLDRLEADCARPAEKLGNRFAHRIGGVMDQRIGVAQQVLGLAATGLPDEGAVG